MNNSRMVNDIIQASKKYVALTGYGKPNVNLIFQGIVTCVISEDSEYLEKYGEESDALSRLVRDKLGDDVELQARLRVFESQNEPLVTDSIMYQKLFKVAQQMAEKSGKKEITADLLFECILQNPTELIRKFIANELDTNPTVENKSDSVKKTDDDDDTLIEENTESNSADVTESEDGKENDDKRHRVSALTDKVKHLQKKLLESIFGQDNAVNIFTTGYFNAEMKSLLYKNNKRPAATFLFAGPPGVGKTFLAETAAETLGLPFKRFDMSEFSDKEANLMLCGYDKVYKSAKPGALTDFVDNNPKCVLLFDEIEKANINVIHLFLQILDAGRLRDNFTRKTVSFSSAIIIMTTNAGKPLYQESETGDFSGISRKVVLNALKSDRDPSTGVPLFPEAICSRFASGNVVMFNRMEAHNLCQIAKAEIEKNIKALESEIGIRLEIDERIYSALLLAEGGNADARSIRSRAETFVNNELFELFRLISSEKFGYDIQSVEKVLFTVELENADKAVKSLFESVDIPEVLVFSDTKNVPDNSGICRYINVSSMDSAVDIIKKREVSFILVDLNTSNTEKIDYLNIEDVRSVARSFLWFLRENNIGIPVYLLQNESAELSEEEKLSFLRNGIRGFVSLNRDSFNEQIEMIVHRLYQQNSVIELTKRNKILTFETAQTFSEQEKSASVSLFDFKLKTSVDSEDRDDVLSSISRPDVSFAKVIGADDAKKELKYFVEYLKNPKKYMGTGARPPRGVILYGPPGTGKTLLAKSMASEADVTFIAAEGNQFLKKYVGEGPEKVHSLFRTARKYAPAILFIDEIDSIAKERGNTGSSVASDEVLTAFLTEMDGFKTDPSKPVFVLAATNYDVNSGSAKSLDPAIVRRFDRKIYIDLPNKENRVQFIKMKVAGNSCFKISEEEIDNIAMRSTGMSLAEIESVLEFSLRIALRSGTPEVTDSVLEESFETYNSGESKLWDKSQLERVARHEAGHAFLCWHGGENPSYITIVARGDHGGYMQHSDNEGKAIYTKEELLSRIRTSLGGRAAEIVYYGENDGVSTGASGDLVSATRLAKNILSAYGMDENFGLAVLEGEKDCAQLRSAVNQILSEEMKKAIALIRENKDCIDRLVEDLLQKNYLNEKEIVRVFSGTADA